MACRDLNKGIAAANEISERNANALLMIMKLDLSSLESVRQFASEVTKRVPQIDILINNAGVMFTKESNTANKFEIAFGVNHLGMNSIFV